MMRCPITWVRFAAVLAFASQVAGDAQCYYPNGNAAPDTEKPCSSASGSACCPDTWICLDNGLCHLPAGNLYGRYSCTDKNWNSPGCAANLCTYGMTLGGGESITQCSNHDNDWCCNGDATHVNCCQESPSPRPFFALQNGNAYATIGSNQASNNPVLSTITGLASGTASGTANSSPPSQTPTPASSAGSRASSDSPFTSLSTSISSGPAGIQTIVVTALISPTSAPNDGALRSKSGSGSNVGIIVGCALGIPLAMALLGIVFWIVRKRYQQNAHPYKETPDVDGDRSSTPNFTGGAAARLGKNQIYRSSLPGTTEIDSSPVGPTRPISAIQGFAELESGSAFTPGHGTPYGPDSVGLGGGSVHDRSSWGNMPPQYSPGIDQVAFGHRRNASGLGSTATLPVIDEKAEGEVQTQAHLHSGSPREIAELSAVKTPQEDVEKQLQG